MLRTVADVAAFEVKLPAAGGIVLLGDSAPAECFLAGDHFRIVTGRDEVVRGAMVDAYHLLLEGNCRVLGLADALRIRRDGMKTLLGVRSRFRPGLLDSDFDSLFAARRSWLDGLKLPESLSEASRRAAAKACSMLKTQVCSPEGRLNHFWSTPDRWPHRRMWLWDSVFHAVGMRRLDPGLARDFISAVFDVSREDGFIPHAASPSGVRRSRSRRFWLTASRKSRKWSLIRSGSGALSPAEAFSGVDFHPSRQRRCRADGVGDRSARRLQERRERHGQFSPV
ncbi:MAG: hypothetical protein L6W00_22830 [Lentisphaeria bacterium]|nr:MAG: hypothetical protein L6W00_22830 [Lentisphaeria bacterium]